MEPLSGLEIQVDFLSDDGFQAYLVNVCLGVLHPDFRSTEGLEADFMSDDGLEADLVSN